MLSSLVPKGLKKAFGPPVPALSGPDTEEKGTAATAAAGNPSGASLTAAAADGPSRRRSRGQSMAAVKASALPNSADVHANTAMSTTAFVAGGNSGGASNAAPSRDFRPIFANPQESATPAADGLQQTPSGSKQKGAIQFSVQPSHHQQQRRRSSSGGLRHHIGDGGGGGGASSAYFENEGSYDYNEDDDYGEDYDDDYDYDHEDDSPLRRRRFVAALDRRLKETAEALRITEEKLRSTTAAQEAAALGAAAAEAALAAERASHAAAAEAAAEDVHVLRPAEALTIHYDPLTGTAGVLACPPFLRRAIRRRSRKIVLRRRVTEEAQRVAAGFGGDREAIFASGGEGSSAYAVSYGHAYRRIREEAMRRRALRRAQAERFAAAVLTSSSSSASSGEDGLGGYSSSSSGEETTEAAIRRRERRRLRRDRRATYSAAAANPNTTSVRFPSAVAPLGIQCFASCGPTLSVVEAMRQRQHNQQQQHSTPYQAHHAPFPHQQQQPHLHSSRQSLPHGSCTTLATPSFCTFCGCRYARLIHKVTGAFSLPRFCTKCGRPAPRYLVNDLPADNEDGTNKAATGRRRVQIDGLFTWDEAAAQLRGLARAATGGTESLGEKARAEGGSNRVEGGSADGGVSRSPSYAGSTNAARSDSDGDEFIGVSAANNDGNAAATDEEGGFAARHDRHHQNPSLNDAENRGTGVKKDSVVTPAAATTMATLNDDAWAAAVLAEAEEEAGGVGMRGAGSDAAAMEALLAPSARYRVQRQYALAGRSRGCDASTQTLSTTDFASSPSTSLMRGRGGHHHMQAPSATAASFAASEGAEGAGSFFEGADGAEEEEVSGTFYVGGGAAAGAISNAADFGSLEDEFMPHNANSGAAHTIAAGRAERQRFDEASRRLVAAAVAAEQQRLRGTLAAKEAESAALRADCGRLRAEVVGAAAAAERRVRESVFNPRLEARWGLLLSAVEAAAREHAV